MNLDSPECGRNPRMRWNQPDAQDRDSYPKLLTVLITTIADTAVMQKVEEKGQRWNLILRLGSIKEVKPKLIQTVS